MARSRRTAHDTAPAVAEDDLLQRVIDTARLYGWRVCHHRPARTSRGWRTPVQGDRGVPDLILARRGTVILAELKSDTGTLGPGQQAWLTALGDHGRLWRPRDWDTEVLPMLAHGRAA